VTNPREIAAFAVTLEPKGGMPQPTGAMYMKGSPIL
jgi:anti-sigma-K factor RskA